jgi:tetratricopeptide (TPR) repeat protein
MRSIVVLFLLAGIADAQPKRKAAPDKFTKAASEAFNAAVEADQKGDLQVALGLYQKAHAISPHPSTIYNVADVQRRLGQLKLAIKSYETYLAMDPNAKDRAEVEKVLDEISKTPGTLIIATKGPSDPDAVDLAASFALVDGEIKKRPGPVPNAKPRNEPAIVVQVPPGEHVVDLVTPLTYATRQCDVDPGGQRICELQAAPRIDGNAVVSAGQRQFHVLRQKRDQSVTYKRFELPAGKHRLLVKDRQYGCPALPIEVAAGNTVAYAFINATDYDGLKRCRTLDIKHHRLQFDP